MSKSTTPEVEVTEEIISEELQENAQDNATETVIPEAEPMETIFIPKDPVNKKNVDMFFSVNGKPYKVMRGMPVKVPLSVAEVWQHSQESDARAEAYREANELQE